MCSNPTCPTRSQSSSPPAAAATHPRRHADHPRRRADHSSKGLRQELPAARASGGGSLPWFKGLRPQQPPGRPTGCSSLPMGSRTLSAPSSTTITAAPGRAGPQGRGRCHGQPAGCHGRRADSSAQLSL